MNCGWESPEQIADCIYFAKRWFQLLIDVVGLGSFALIALLIWLFQRLRSDLSKWESEAAREKELRQSADSTAAEARHRAELAESIAARALKDKEELDAALRADSDELRTMLAETTARLSDAAARVDGALGFTAGGTTAFWSRLVGHRLDNYEQRMASSIPVLMFGNQKGGVGKSTLVANLAGAFASRGERVLCVDLDYQGSFSSLAQLQTGRLDEEPESLIDWLFQDELDPNWTKLAIKTINSEIHYIPAYYTFETIERRFEYAWALRDAKDDVRYRLARATLSSFIQESYDRVLIDAPPRFTLGFVNGFCATTHLFVPTVVDALSSSAVNAFARQFSELKPVVNPHITWAGMIGTMTFRNPHDRLQLPKNAERFAQDAERAAQSRLNTREQLFIRNPVIIRDADLAQATDRGIAYLNDSRVRPMFDALAFVIETKAPPRRTRR